MQKRRKVGSSKRPIAVTIVAWGIVLLFLVRLVQVFEPLIRMDVLGHGLTGPLASGLRLTPLGLTVAASAAYLALSLVGIVVLVGFLRVRRWAWVLLMAWTGFSLAISLLNYFYTRPNYLVMASNTVIALALNQGEVRRIFKIRMEPSEPVNQPAA
jgi:hypothetical protein